MNDAGGGCAAELAIVDRLAPGPLTAKELARETDSDGRAIYLVLRALASVGVFTEGKDGRFVLIPVEDLLRTGVAGSQRDSAIMAAESEPKSSTAGFFYAARLRLSRIVPTAHEVSVIGVGFMSSIVKRRCLAWRMGALQTFIGFTAIAGGYLRLLLHPESRRKLE